MSIKVKSIVVTAFFIKYFKYLFYTLKNILSSLFLDFVVFIFVIILYLRVGIT